MGVSLEAATLASATSLARVRVNQITRMRATYSLMSHETFFDAEGVGAALSGLGKRVLSS